MQREQEKLKLAKIRSQQAYEESRRACDIMVQRRAQEKEEDRLEDIRLQEEWSAELQRREDERKKKYDDFKANQKKRERIYESTGGAEDAAREAHERAVTEKYWKLEQEKRERLARQKQERLAR